MSINTLGEIFFENYKKFLDNYAVIYSDGKSVKKSTYEQLANESYKISECLKSVNATGFIGIFVEQEFSLPAVLLGILHNGLPFVCIDFQDLESKIISLLEYLNINWVLSKNNCVYAKGLLSKLGTESKSVNLCDEVYIIWQINVNVHLENKLTSVPNSFKLAYAIQSSGSTGIPKVIRVSHQSILPNIFDLSDILQVHQTDVICWASPLTFDPNIIEFFLPFLSGAALLVVPPLVRASPLSFLEVLFPTAGKDYAGTSILQTTPSSFSRWSVHDIQMRILNKTTTLKKLLLGGEPCPNMAVLSKWKGEDNATQIFNIYGVTEVSCWASVQRVNFSSDLNSSNKTDVIEEDALDIPLGSPLSKTVLHVRNDMGSVITCGEGELFVGSSERVCLVNGEIVEQLSLPVFRATGDLVKWDEHCKCIKFIGRKNRIIKRWGQKVCLNKVEMVLGKHPSVEKCCCVWIEDVNSLVVAVVWKEKEECDTFRLFCIDRLHKTEVPDATLSFKSLPLTSHGKIDFKKLQVIVLNKRLPSKRDNEETSLNIVEALKRTLGREPSLLEHFMSSGGNSLLAVQLTSEIEKYFGESIRSKVMTMLLSDCSFFEMQTYLLAHEQDKNPPNLNFKTVLKTSTSIMKDSLEKTTTNKNESRNEDEGQSSISEKVCSISNKRKLSHFKKVSKQGRVHSKMASVSFDEKNHLQISEHEDKLIGTCCRGKLVKKEIWSNQREFNEENKISFYLNWKFNMNKCVDASPCYLKFSKKSWTVIGSHSHLLVVLENSTGKMVSRCELPDRIESSVCPSVCGRYGIVGCYDKHVYCITLDSGQIKWSFHTGDIVKSSPVLGLENTSVIVGSYDSNLYCIDMKDGELIWRSSLSPAGIYASPCISKNSVIYVGTLDGTCVAVHEGSGQTMWKRKLSTPAFSSPTLIHSESAVIFAEVVGIVHAFSASDGTKLWQFQGKGNIFSSFSTLHVSCHCYELLVFGNHDRNIYCIKWEDNQSDVLLLWKQELDSAVFATPYIYTTNNLCDMSIKNSFIIAATTEGTLYLLNARDGSIKCSHSVGNEIFSSPVVCEDQVVVGCRDDHCYCFCLTKQC